MKAKNKIILAAAIGNFLEYYDFALFGCLIPALSIHFFPNENQYSILMTLLIYAVGFISRPLGGVIFGHIGDVYGRKKSLSISLSLMSISSLLMGLLPTYEQIGIYATMLLVILRFLQGICVGGEYGNSIIFAIEHSMGTKSKIVAGAILGSSTLIGCLCASLISALFSYQGFDFSWRLPFIFGSLIGVCGVYIRLRVTDTPEFSYNFLHNKIVNMPLKTLLLKYKTSLITSMFLIAITGITTGTSTTFLLVYLTTILHFKMYESQLMVALFLSIYIISSFVPIILSNRKDNLKLLYISLLGLSFASLPIFLFTTSDLAKTIIAQLLLAGISGIIWGSINLIITNLFPSYIRCSGMTLSDGISRSCVSGLLPFIAMYLFNSTGSIALIGVTLSVISLASFILLYKTHPVHLTRNSLPIIQ